MRTLYDGQKSRNAINIFVRSLIIAFFVPFCLLTNTATFAQVNVLTYHNDQYRTGQNNSETVLAPNNVTSSLFGKLFRLPVDGFVYAQPLYVSHLNIPGQGVHNVVFVATEHDSVYAFDADQPTSNSAPLWKHSFINPATGVKTVPVSGGPDGYVIVPEIGITSTPVIDLNTSTLYVEAMTAEKSGGVTTYVHRLHALDITTGIEKTPFPVVIQGSVQGNSLESIAGIVNFVPFVELQRLGLALDNGIVYVGFAGRTNTYRHGWMFGYDAIGYGNSPGAQAYLLCMTPNGGEAGLWQSGGAPAVDPSGNLYLVTGNGSFDGTVNPVLDWAQSVLKLTPGQTLAVADSFTPYNWKELNVNDTDFGSGSAMLLPDSFGSQTHPHLLTVCGKEGTLYLLDRNALGGYSPIQNQVVQSVVGANSGAWSTPTCFSGLTGQFLYYCGSGDIGTPGDRIKQFAMVNGLISPSPVAQAPTITTFPGSILSVSSNGAINGIIWANETSGFVNGAPSVLHAYDAINISHELYNSNQDPNRDILGPATKFAAPTIANGKVYVGTAYEVDVFGLLPGTGPSIVVPASSSPAIVNSTTSSLYVLGADSLGEQNLTYTWSASAAGGGSVAFSDNSDNTAKSVTATYSAIGTYTLTCTVSDSLGLKASSSVTLSVQSAPTTVLVTPSSTTVSLNTSVQFNALAVDQFSQPIAAQPQFGWSLLQNSVGTINPTNGLYNSGGYGLSSTVQATNTTTSQFGLAYVSVLDTAPVITSVASASPNPTTGTTTVLSITATDDEAASLLTYTWTVLPGAPGSVIFSSNGTNSAHTTTATFSALGSYLLQCTVSNRAGSTTVSQVTVIVQPTETAIVISPTSPAILINTAQSFSATTVDQFGNPLSVQPKITWSIEGQAIGQINATNGLYTSGNVIGTDVMDAIDPSTNLIGRTTVNVVNVAPSILTPANANPNPVIARSTVVSMQAASNVSTLPLTYTWTAVSAATAPVIFNPNSSTANTTTANFQQAGVYSLQGTAANTQVMPASSSVTVTVLQTPTTINVAPANPTITIGGSLQFTVAVNDQFGASVTINPKSIVWAIKSGGAGGSINSNGLYLATTAAPGTDILTATYGSISATSTITILGAPPILMSATASNQSVQLTWTMPAGSQPTGYNVYRGTSPGQEGATPLNSSPIEAGSLAFQDTMVNNYVEYYYNVRALYPGYVSQASNELSAQPTHMPPTISAPTLTSYAPTTASFTVTGNDDAGAGYIVYNWSATGPASVSFTNNGVYNANTTTAIFTKPGTYKITATLDDIFGTTASSTITYKVIQQISNLTISPGSTKVIELKSHVFKATATDQFGTTIKLAPSAFTWSIAFGGSGGIIQSPGVYVAPNNTGVDGVVVSYGGLVAIALVKIVAAE